MVQRGKPHRFVHIHAVVKVYRLFDGVEQLLLAGDGGVPSLKGSLDSLLV